MKRKSSALNAGISGSFVVRFTVEGSVGGRIAFEAVFLFDFLLLVRKIADNFETGEFNGNFLGICEPKFRPWDSFVLLDVLKKEIKR